MTLDTTSLITLTDAALEGGNALSAMAGAVAASTATDAGTMIVVIGSSPHAQQVMEQRSNALCATGDLLCRSNLVTLPARENAQRFAGLLGMLGVDALLLDPVPPCGCSHVFFKARHLPSNRPHPARTTSRSG